MALRIGRAGAGGSAMNIVSMDARRACMVGVELTGGVDALFANDDSVISIYVGASYRSNKRRCMGGYKSSERLTTACP